MTIDELQSLLAAHEYRLNSKKFVVTVEEVLQSQLNLKTKKIKSLKKIE